MEVSRDFVYKKFCEYYRDPSTIIPAPVSNSQREFAYLLFKERFMIRHKRFEKIENLRSMLNETVPSDVYHSCAYYENPDFEMNKKGWLGADLVFDIDADHIPTTCDKIHDEFTCVKCGFKVRGISPETCPACEETKFESKTWPCEICLKSARDETAKLIDMLEKDFGFSLDDLHVFFSGHRGYHVHVEDESVKSLDAMARKEIVDYVTGLGLAIFDKDAKSKPGKRAAQKFSLHNYGWNRRLKLGMQNFLFDATKEDLKKIGLKNNAVLKNKETIIKRCINEGRWESIKDVSVQTWLKIADHAREMQSANIDTVVTTDVHRLIRMNGTLHGKTGLKKVEFPAKNLQDFDPFTGAVAFKKGAVKVLVSDAPMFKLGGETLGPYKNETIELPVAAGVMLICKGRAKVVD
ncbi:MAG TPA: DNA primase small subunit PriS [Candidatus Acidoferrum sp.]|nr:DNA primase small subunit PriS [Candidatus Acidoferrum sp.]